MTREWNDEVSFDGPFSDTIIKENSISSCLKTRTANESCNVKYREVNKIPT